MEKIVSQLDQNGRYIGPVVADLSPLEPGVYLLPGGAVDAAPHDVPEGMFAQWNGAGFDLITIPVPEPEPEPEPEPTEANATILAELASLDAQRVRPLAEITLAQVAGEPIPLYAKAKLADIEKQASELREKLK